MTPPSVLRERIGIDRSRSNAQGRLAKRGCKIPSLDDVESEQNASIRRADMHGVAVDDCCRDPDRIKCYAVDVSKCPASCVRAFNYAKLDILPRAIDLIEAHTGPCAKVRLFVTLVHPDWRYRVGDLSSFDVGKAKAALRRWLRSSGLDNLIGLGAFEVSLDRERDGTRCWQGHFHGVFAGAAKAELRRALEVRDRSKLAPFARPLVIKPASSVAACLGYALKGGAEVRVAYVHENGRQHRGKDRLRATERIEHHAWISKLPVFELLTLVGIRRYGGMLRPIAKNSPKTPK